MASASSPPVVPLEIKAHILSFCNPSTLAAACRVSFAFLGLASPHLYQHVELDTCEQLELLFCDSVSTYACCL